MSLNTTALLRYFLGTLTLAYFVFVSHAALALNHDLDRRSVAEDLVKELRELEKAVEGEEANDTGPDVTAADTDTDQDDTASDTNDAEDVVDEAVDEAEKAMEAAADKAEDEVEKSTDDTEDLMDEEAEEAEDAIEEAVEKAEDEMEKARERVRGNFDGGSGGDAGRRGRGKGKKKTGRNRFFGKGEGKKPGRGRPRADRLTEEQRREERMKRRQMRSLQRLVRFLEKRLQMLEEAIPEENRDRAMFEVLRLILDQAKEYLAAEERETTPAEGETTPAERKTIPAEGETTPSEGGTPSGTEGKQASSDAPGESPSEGAPDDNTRQLRQLFRLLANKPWNMNYIITCRSIPWNMKVPCCLLPSLLCRKWNNSDLFLLLLFVCLFLMSVPDVADELLMEFMYLVFTRKPAESCCRRFRSLSLCSKAN